MSEDDKKRINAVFVVGGDWHDVDFARLEILKLLSEDERIRTRVFEDYDSARGALADADFLISYTTNVVGGLDTQEALKGFVESGKRWYALHGTNSVLRFLSPEGAGYGQLLVDAPRWTPLFMETLGSQFVAHPPVAPYRVEVTAPDHPMVEGVEPFEATDELYLMETHGDLEVMLHCEFGGKATGFVEKDWEKAQHPVFYKKAVGEGEVLYLTLGHCRGHYDMEGVTDYYPAVERGSWDLPVFYTLLRRGIDWAKEPALA
ncbi:MAG: ThuA domain-containing protein [Pseudomonadota bacterium]